MAAREDVKEQTEGVGPDGHRTAPKDPYAAGHRLLDDLLREALMEQWWLVRAREQPAGQAILASDKTTQVTVLHAALDRLAWFTGGGREPLEKKRVLIERRDEFGVSRYYTDQAAQIEDTLSAIVEAIAGRKLPLTYDDLLHMLQVVVLNMERPSVSLRPLPDIYPDIHAEFLFDAEVVEDQPRIKAPPFDLFQNPVPGVIPAILGRLEGREENEELPADLRPWLERLRAILEQHNFWAGYGRTVTRIDCILGDVREGLPDPGRVWADALLQNLSGMPPDARKAWQELLAHAPVANRSEPSARWTAQARKLLDAVGVEEFKRRVTRWFSLVGEDPTEHFSDRTADILKGLIWYCHLVEDEAISRLLGSTAEECFKRIGETSLLCSRAGRACLYSLSALPGPEPVAQLVRLQQRVKSPWASEQIRLALDRAAEKAGLSQDDLEEITLPTYGLEAPAILRQKVGSFTAEITFDGSRPEWRWLDEDGKAQKSIPEAVKEEHAEALKALKQTVSEIRKMLSAQRERMERLLLTGRSWPLSVWRERYLEHPLLAGLSRRLIWHFQQGRRKGLGIWHEGRLVDVEGRPLKWLTDATTVRLWHPIGFAPEEVLQWRRRLEEHGVTQPFKQAHREVYLLTDAELETRTYSNRFAAHILRQHQFAALCRERGWHYDYLGSWDCGECGASRELPQWHMRVEFWADWAGGGTARSGVNLYVSTDQVRFCDPGGQPRPLVEVPAIVFTEMMRDVDLFVGVASIGNDPAWHDRGEEGYQDYWHAYSFGDLSASAQTRGEVLERLLPRLKIRDRCSLEGKFLIVRGDLRTYRIHLGSANILMEPNDQYLCIVPDRGGAASRDQVFLPFEGDTTLSVILSKAFLLAEDTKIKDPTIVRQIKLR
jgi:uncharacterized protein DUF4132